MVRSCLAVSKATLYSKGLPCVFLATVKCKLLLFSTEKAQKHLFLRQPVKSLWHNDWNVLGDRHPRRVKNQSQRCCGFSPRRRTMKTLNKVAMIIATAALATVAGAQSVDNWRNASGDTWKNSTGLCWRDANWTPATAAVGCDGAIVAPAPAPVVPKAAPAPAPAPVAVPAPVAPKPAPAPQPPAATKVTYAADAFFDFDKSVLKAEGKAKLDDLVGKVKGINLEVIIAVGHTDSVGADAYNQKLSVKRSEAVKAYLVTKGIEKNRVYTEGKGEKQPVADNKTSEGRAKNRRVEIEVVGTRAN
jgi:OOP family OmpA-OmpF porin